MLQTLIMLAMGAPRSLKSRAFGRVSKRLHALEMEVEVRQAQHAPALPATPLLAPARAQGPRTRPSHKARAPRARTHTRLMLTPASIAHAGGGP